ncbi:hypothetical protein P389DRAFT_22371 [Cystobasidium minutum MCA 4210]|uniref:uncharacterized protein n=1 Tax=Cystobasidium minutum MCA 4210 TaxID=1397322 RepID=UPI0034CF162B|eukprot:jgi/Rhomi1/22371/CE22370_475
MPSFIFQLATTAIALATTMRAPGATAAPIDIRLFNDNIHAIQAAGSSIHHTSNSAEVKHYHNVYPVMRTLTRDEYHLSAIQRNQEYQTTLEQLDDIVSSRPEQADDQIDHAHAQQLATSAYVGACTAKVVGDLEDINAYHRSMMQAAITAYEDGLANPTRHTVNLLELRQAQKEARSLRIYSDLDILREAEEHCQPSTLLASTRASLSSSKALLPREAVIADLLD